MAVSKPTAALRKIFDSKQFNAGEVASEFYAVTSSQEKNDMLDLILAFIDSASYYHSLKGDDDTYIANFTEVLMLLGDALD